LKKNPHPCPWGEDAEGLCENAVKDGDLERLKALRENDNPYRWYADLNWNATYYAAERGYLDCLRYAHENGCRWSSSVPLIAVQNGHMACLKYAHENGCPCNKETCYVAARKGNLGCLKYLHENGCPCNEEACEYAAAGGSLDCLKYLHEHGCPWNEETCTEAGWSGHLDCLQYAHENGCPLTIKAYPLSREDSDPRIREYLMANGIPEPSREWLVRQCAYRLGGEYSRQDENGRMYVVDDELGRVYLYH